MTNPYEYADKQIDILRKNISGSFQNAENTISFDEINLITAKASTKALYKLLISYNRTCYRKIAKKAYDKAIEEALALGFILPNGETNKLTALTALYYAYHPVTAYRYDRESERKQDRLTESILSATTVLAMRVAFGRAARLWFNQSRQYADLTVDTTRIQAFKDAGVKKVMWVSEHDSKVCSECGGLDGQVFEIDQVPDKPHMNCRCYLKPVK